MNIGRLKFEIDDLVCEMLDHLPAEIFKSDSTTFLDLDIGGGQFVKEVEKRLKDYGHSNQNISQRVFGFAPSHIESKYAIETHSLIGGYRIYNIKTLEYPYINMKFDVIVGNPPYQHPTNKNRAHPIWALLLEKSFSLLKEGGFLAYITPDSWRTPSSKLTKYFTSYKLLWLYLDAKKYFRKINSKFSVYVIKKEKSYDGYETAVISNGSSSKFNLFGLDFIPEISKVAFKLVSEFSKKPKMQLQSVGNPWRSDTNWNVSDIKDKIFKYELFHIHKKNLYAKTKHPLQTTKKVILNKTGTWNPFYSDSLGFTHIHLARVVSTAEEGKLVEQYLNSDILKFYIKIMNIFGARDKFTMDNIPEMPIDYSNNYNLYKYFNLTREEIDYIESHI